MPLRQYVVLRKAVEIEAIVQRRIHIQDINRAFHDAKPLMNQLEKELRTLLHSKDDDGQSEIVNWGKDSDWKNQLSKFQA